MRGGRYKLAKYADPKHFELDKRAVVMFNQMAETARPFSRKLRRLGL
jgi:hypothetical protein